MLAAMPAAMPASMYLIIASVVLTNLGTHQLRRLAPCNLKSSEQIVT
jgi:hypothetical protein